MRQSDQNRLFLGIASTICGTLVAFVVGKWFIIKYGLNDRDKRKIYQSESRGDELHELR